MSLMINNKNKFLFKNGILCYSEFCHNKSIQMSCSWCVTWKKMLISIENTSYYKLWQDHRILFNIMRLGQNQNCQKKGKKKKKAYISQYWVFFIYSVCCRHSTLAIGLKFSFRYSLQRHIQKPIKHLSYSFHQK